jgi:hypothetical protein
MKSKYLIGLAITVGACQSAIKDKNASAIVKEDPSQTSYTQMVYQPRVITENLSIYDEKDLLGYWVGDFEPDTTEDGIKYIETGTMTVWTNINKINISIDSIADGRVIGHSVVAGNFRPFEGSIEKKEGNYVFNVKEPGDDKYDGVFSFDIQEMGNTLSGKWKAYKPIETPKRKFKLKKTLFKYKPEAELEEAYVDWKKNKTVKIDDDDDTYEYETYFSTTMDIYKHNSSTDILNKKTLENLSKADIFILRNSIYAKHGYSFKNRQLRAYFDAQPWYIPLHVEIRKDLSDIEKENIKQLLRYEKNAEEYYDEFGR